MKFNTAILYDIENLMGGYGNTDLLSTFSLKDIHNEIAKKETGNIAIQRAYANWSDPRLNIMRGDIIELGIEPVQMFGFGRGSQKNASDIQLAIDAVDIAFTKPAVETFIIVSGDGGFSSLAKKLHECGKMVIGCAYRRSTNRVFNAVCDDFIWIDEPREENGIVSSASRQEFTDPILIAYSKKYKPVTVTNREQIISLAKEILNFFEKNRDAEYMLGNVGMNISIFNEAIDYRVGGFNYLQHGFLRLVDFIRYIVNGTKCKLICRPPSDYRLVLDSVDIPGFEYVEPLLEIEEIHTADNYKKLLSKGTPLFRIPNKEIVFNIANYLSENKLEIQGVNIGDIIDRLGNQFEYEQNDIRGTVLSLAAADCFLREPEGTKISEQKLSFIYLSAEHALKALQSKMHEKLLNLLGEVKEQEFIKIF
jgi:uncharacterized LabA/DUF88 family protein